MADFRRGASGYLGALEHTYATGMHMSLLLPKGEGDKTKDLKSPPCLLGKTALPSSPSIHSHWP